MPEQNSQNPVAFNPSNFALTASDQPAAVYTVRADAGSDYAELSCYVQHLFQLPRSTKSPGGKFSDQPQPEARSAQEFRLAMRNQYEYRPTEQTRQDGYVATAAPQHSQRSFAPPRSVNPPGFAESVNPPGFAESGQTMNFSDQGSDISSGQNFNSYVPQETHSFAPPADRSSLPYAPPAPGQQRRAVEQQDTVEHLRSSNGGETDASNMILVGQSLGGARPNQTKMVDLRQQKTTLEKPSRDQNTVAKQPEFLNRDSFSNKFSVKSKESTETEASQESSSQKSTTPSKVIYLRSVETKPQPSAKLVEPTFEPKPTQPTEPTEPYAPKISEALLGDSPPAPIVSLPQEQDPLPAAVEAPVVEIPPAVAEAFAANPSPFTDIAPPQPSEPTQPAEVSPPTFTEKNTSTQQPTQENSQTKVPVLEKTEAQGFTDSDFFRLEQRQEFRNSINQNARAKISQSTPSGVVAETPSTKNPFQIASHRRSSNRTRSEPPRNDSKSDYQSRHADPHAGRRASIADEAIPNDNRRRRTATDDHCRPAAWTNKVTSAACGTGLAKPLVDAGGIDPVGVVRRDDTNLH